MKLRASIDIGSNSILLLIGKFSNNGIEILENESNVTGLGRDLDLNGVFIDEAMSDSRLVLSSYSDICKKHNIQPASVVVTATEASRVAQNAQHFFDEVKKECGLNVKIITGEAEAFYSTTGILFDKKINDPIITIMDIGGASTELIKVSTKEKKILKSFSMPVGAVRMNNWADQGCRVDKLKEVLSNFKTEIDHVKCDKLYCVAGTMTSVGNMFLNNESFEENQVNGLEFSKSDLDSMHNELKQFSVQQFLNKFPFLGKRSKTILSGIVLAKSILEELETKEMYISTYGLRYGTLLAGEIKDDFIK